MPAKEASLKRNGQGDQTLQSFQVGDDIFCRSDPHHMPSRLVLPFCNLGQGSQGCSLASSIKDLLFCFVDPPPPPLPSMAQFGVQATQRFAIFVPRLKIPVFLFGLTPAQFR